MSKLEPSIDLGKLATKLTDLPDITNSLKEKIRDLLVTPETPEQLENVINVATTRTALYPSLNLANMDKPLIKARFHLTEELDYV